MVILLYTWKMALSFETINVLSVAQVLYVLATSESHYAIGRSLKGEEEEDNVSRSLHDTTRFRFPLFALLHFSLVVPTDKGR